MKKIFLIIITILVLTGCKSKEITNTPLMKSNNFQELEIENVTSLEIIEYTIDGKKEKIIDNHDDILKQYNNLNNFKIGKETNMICEDNTTIYNFIQNNKTISIEINCGNILVIEDKRYELVK